MFTLLTEKRLSSYIYNMIAELKGNTMKWRRFIQDYLTHEIDQYVHVLIRTICKYIKNFDMEQNIRSNLHASNYQHNWIDVSYCQNSFQCFKEITTTWWFHLCYKQFGLFNTSKTQIINFNNIIAVKFGKLLVVDIIQRIFPQLICIGAKC